MLSDAQVPSQESRLDMFLIVGEYHPNLRTLSWPSNEMTAANRIGYFG